jgi:hypothetical protein
MCGYTFTKFQQFMIFASKRRNMEAEAISIVYVTHSHNATKSLRHKYH